MSRLLVLCEGHTEMGFVEDPLRWHLAAKGFDSVSARLFGGRRSRAARGGIVKWPRALRDISRHLTEDKSVIITTMVDYYGLPSGAGGWPGRQESQSVPDAARRVEAVEVAMPMRSPKRSGATRLFASSRSWRFTSSKHSCSPTAASLRKPPSDPKATVLRPDWMQRCGDSHGGPEEIDGAPHGAPSKRIEQAIPGYRKRVMGLRAARQIGIPAMVAACPHFASWIERLVACGGSDQLAG